MARKNASKRRNARMMKQLDIYRGKTVDQALQYAGFSPPQPPKKHTESSAAPEDVVPRNVVVVEAPQKVQSFGEPFVFVIHDGETLADVKARIQEKLHVSDEEFSKLSGENTQSKLNGPSQNPKFGHNN